MSVVMEIMVFLNKRPNGPKKSAHLGKYRWMVYEGGVWSVYWMSVAIGIVMLFSVVIFSQSRVTRNRLNPSLVTRHSLPSFRDRTRTYKRLRPQS
jgi:hypothetical protein